MILDPCFGFALLCPVIGQFDSFNQSNAKLKQSLLGHKRFPALQADHQSSVRSYLLIYVVTVFLFQIL